VSSNITSSTQLLYHNNFSGIIIKLLVHKLIKKIKSMERASGSVSIGDFQS